MPAKHFHSLVLKSCCTRGRVTVFLLIAAGALVCQTCTNTQCSTQAAVTCTTETMCVTANIQATSSGVTVPQIFKGCASPSLCPATGSQTFSVNLGASSAVTSAECCNTDNCNTATLPAPATPTANSLQCFYCTDQLCNTPLTCRGNEDRCFQASCESLRYSKTQIV
ncbi:phospholipase A2 inhibitor and Ly6/PLAUR domain-containing protein-like [Acanthopagrus latus]|uniref:phospholipase A2 inhibitor and Ly6/PLAUR domain-containing protein-like n=1 Tax=Acanthopagrus latus TaxID=8177 RepID=UPI00187CD0F3|nr:phospholipase A2 inhibitor and Ly6/PLAUR domain-containing protein-like [Acanthopagrus latus]